MVLRAEWSSCHAWKWLHSGSRTLLFLSPILLPAAHPLFSYPGAVVTQKMVRDLVLRWMH
jgi:hypothetical protein